MSVLGRLKIQMNQGFEALNKHGAKGVAVFWLKIFLFPLVLAIFIFSIVWMAKSSSKIWLKAAGSSILIATIFLFLVSLAGLALFVLSVMGAKFLPTKFLHHLTFMIFFVGQAICCILMSLSTSNSAARYLSDINDYIVRFSTDKVVTDFVTKNPTGYAKFAYVAQRSTDFYSVIAVFFVLWFGATVILIFCLYKLPDDIEEKQEDTNPLINQQPPQEPKQPQPAQQPQPKAAEAPPKQQPKESESEETESQPSTHTASTQKGAKQAPKKPVTSSSHKSSEIIYSDGTEEEDPYNPNEDEEEEYTSET